MLRRQLKRQRTTPQDSRPSPQAAEAQAEEGEDWDACAELVDDTLAAIQLLTSRSAAGFAAIDLPPLVLWHQLCVTTSAATKCYSLRCMGAL